MIIMKKSYINVMNIEVSEEKFCQLNTTLY